MQPKHKPRFLFLRSSFLPLPFVLLTFGCNDESESEETEVVMLPSESTSDTVEPKEIV